jgi:hypothetical protein
MDVDVGRRCCRRRRVLRSIVDNSMSESEVLLLLLSTVVASTESDRSWEKTVAPATVAVGGGTGIKAGADTFLRRLHASNEARVLAIRLLSVDSLGSRRLPLLLPLSLSALGCR